MTSKAQLMVFCRFPDIETNRIVEHYLFCQLVGVRETAEMIFKKLNKFFEKKRLDWSKHKSVTTDDTAAMQGSQKSAVKKIKQLSPECAGIYCILHREILVMKKLKLNAVVVGGKENELIDVLWEVVTIVNLIRKSAKQQRLFSKLCNKMGSTSKKLILHSKLQWLSRRKMLSHVFEFQEQLEVYCSEQENQKAAKFLTYCD